MQLVAVIVTF